MKQYNREQEEIAHMKEYIARFGHGSAKLARQAQSKEKTVCLSCCALIQQGPRSSRRWSARVSLRRSRLTLPSVSNSSTAENCRPRCCNSPMWISATPQRNSSSGTSTLVHPAPLRVQTLKVDPGVDLDSRIALVGPNGKETVFVELWLWGLKSMGRCGEKHPLEADGRRTRSHKRCCQASLTSEDREVLLQQALFNCHHSPPHP